MVPTEFNRLYTYVISPPQSQESFKWMVTENTREALILRPALLKARFLTST